MGGSGVLDAADTVLAIPAECLGLLCVRAKRVLAQT